MHLLVRISEKKEKNIIDTTWGDPRMHVSSSRVLCFVV